MKDLGINTIDLYLTGSCNYKCEYCYGESDANPHMTYKTLISCLEFADEIGVKTVELCGGEPLLSPIFKDVVYEVKKRGFDIILRTNGILLEKYIELVAKNCQWVGISLDGLQEVNAMMRPSNQGITPKTQFEIPISNIKELKRINPHIKILLATIATEQNYKGIIDLCEFIIEDELSIDKWKIYQFIRDKFRSDINYEKFTLSSDKFDYLLNKLPESLPNGAEVTTQSSDSEGAGGNCLLVYFDGTIKILDEYFGKIGEDDTKSIYNKLKGSSVVKYIKNNKMVTYANE